MIGQQILNQENWPKSILVKTGAAVDDKKYDAIATYEAKNLLEAVNKIKVIENDNF